MRRITTTPPGTRPTIENTLPDNAIIVARPIFCRISQAGKLFGLSTTSIYAVLKQAAGRPEWKDIAITLGPSTRLVNIEIMKSFLLAENGKWLTDRSRAKKA